MTNVKLGRQNDESFVSEKWQKYFMLQPKPSFRLAG
jgi:hypothetical protein